MPADVVYAGHGHFSHRLSPTIWENPFRVGRDGTHVDTLFHYINHVPSSPLVDKLDTLDGMRIACDCPLDHPCHVDVLIGTRMMQIYRHSSTSRKRRFPRQLLLMAGVRVVRAMPLPLNQVSAYQLIQWQFPCVDFSHVRWPLLEDVLTQPMFRSFQDWVHQQGLPADGPLGPNVLIYIYIYPYFKIFFKYYLYFYFYLYLYIKYIAHFSSIYLLLIYLFL